MVTWEPWLTDFENAQHPHLPLRADRDRHGLADVARGGYDVYIDTWAAAAAEFARPILVRFGHEMNDPYRYPWGPQNNTKEDFIAAWRHVVERFRQAGADNVLWIWAPHVAYEHWELYYPGDDYVDWVSTGALNFGTVAHWSEWWSFRELFGQKYDAMASFGKPVMIDEFGSLTVGGDRAAWYDEALTDLPTKYPAVRALLFFHARQDRTLTYQTVDWSIVRDPEIAQTIAAAVASWKDDPSPD
jgi:beta-mannanase